MRGLILILAQLSAVLAFTGRLTWFEPQSVACDGQSFKSDSDLVVAMNGAQFKGSCGKCVSITYQGKTVRAKVVDECPSEYCAYGFVDASKGVFSHFAGLDVGVLQMSWEYVSCDGKETTNAAKKISKGTARRVRH